MPRPRKYFTEDERKEASRAANRAYYAKNRQKMIARSMAYYQAHREEINAYARARYATLDRVQQYHRKYRIEHKEDYRIYQSTEDYKAKKRIREARYRAAHREQIRARNREFYRRKKLERKG